MPKFLQEIVNALKTKTGISGLLVMLIPFLNPWLATHGYPTFVTTTTTQPAVTDIPAITGVPGTPGTLGYLLAGFALIAARAAIQKIGK